jgi:hypothetical protein
LSLPWAYLRKLQIRIDDIVEEDWWPFVRALFDLRYDLNREGQPLDTIVRVVQDAEKKKQGRSTQGGGRGKEET